MKILICSILLVLSSFVLKAQTYPIPQNLGGPTTLVQNPNYGGFKGGLIPYTFADTTAANTALTYLKNYNGAVIATNSPIALWYRDLTNTVWLQLSVSGSPTVNAWLTRGNDLSTQSLPNRLGTKNGDLLNIITSDQIRAIIPAGGIVRSSSAQNRFLMQDTVGKEIYYGDFGGNLTPTWQQTLTAGSTLTTDNTVLLSGFNLEFQGNGADAFNILGVNSFGVNDANGTRITASPTETQIISPTTATRSSSIDVHTDDITVKPGLGVLYIDTLNNETFQNSLIGWTSTSGANRGKVGYLTVAGSLSLSSGVLTGTGITGLTVGTTTIASGTIGGVIFQGAGNVVQQDATNLFWDDTNNRLGVGTNAPANTFDALSSGTAGRFKSSSYSSSTVIIEDPDGTTWITNGQFRVNTVPFVLNANASYLSLQTAGVERINVANAGDITLKGATIYAIPVTTGVDLSGGQYNAADAGLYHITVGDVSNAFNLPDAAAMTGKTVKIIMKVGDSSPITSSGGSVFDKLGSALSTITGGTYTFTSDGTDWWEF